jgi:hypothetical protein
MPSKSDERWQAEQLFRRLQISPAGLTERESPDFTFDLDGKTIGLEVREGMDQEYRRGHLLKHREFPNSAVNVTHLKDRTQRRSNDELRSEMLAVGNEWLDYDTAMTEWRQKIDRAILNKRDKLNKPGYMKFAENWLLIYDKPELPHDAATRDTALQLLFSKADPCTFDFNAIYILSDNFLFRCIEGRLSLVDNHE